MTDCEKIIEKQVKTMTGVKKIDVDYETEQLKTCRRRAGY
jgi:copper chaperone CopZ